MNIVVLGAGAWGTALALSAAGNPLAQHRVTLWGRDRVQLAAMQAQAENRRYLPGFALPPSLHLSSAALVPSGALLGTADLIIIATPMAALRGLLAELAPCRVPVAWLCKGFAAEASPAAGLLGHEIQAQAAPNLLSGVLSGPSFAQEVARGQPTALVAASAHAMVREALVTALHSPTLRVYAFDYNLDLSAIRTLEELRKVKDSLPALVVNDGAAVYGFKSVSEMQKLIPRLATLATSTSATSTVGY